MRSIPSSFQLGGRTWQVAIVDEIEGAKDTVLGQSNSCKAVIQITSHQSAECAQHTFYHELVHAICATIGYGKLDKDEDKIDSIGNMLLQFEQTRVDT